MKKRHIRNFVLFCFSGILAFAIDFYIYQIFSLNLRLYFAKFISIIFGMSSTFIFNKFITFKYLNKVEDKYLDSQRYILRQYIYYLTSQIPGMTTNFIVFFFLTNILMDGSVNIISFLLATLSGAIINYILAYKIVFSEKR